MYEIFQQLLNYARGMWRYRWYAMALAWAIAGVAWVKIHYLPDVYSVSARVQLDTESILTPLMRGLALEPNLTQQLRMVSRTLLSRPNLEKLARMSDLDLGARSPEELEGIVSRLSSTIQVVNDPREPNFYVVSYEHKDPRTAQRVVENLLDILVESTLGETRENTDTAQKFLMEQIKEYEGRLFAAEERLKEFKRENARFMPTVGQGYFQTLEAARRALEESRLGLSESRNRRDELKRQLGGEEPVFGFDQQSRASAGPPHELDARIRELRAQVDELSLQYTDAHPRVESIRANIEILEEQRRVDLENTQPVTPRAPQLESNPIYQQLRVSLAEAEAQVASYSARVAEHRTRVAELEKLVDTLPQVEAELNRLNRDYEIHKQNYDAFVTRLETAKISEEVETSGDSVRIDVIEPPRLPLSPSGPNRLLFNVMALFVGLGAGFALAFVLSQLRPVIHDERTLRQASGRPVFGVVSRVWTVKMLRKKRLEYGGFTSAAVLLFVVFGGVSFLW
jgi:polysaccharide chain length determinant protein (PEP-CTERM system associated)